MDVEKKIEEAIGKHVAEYHKRRKKAKKKRKPYTREFELFWERFKGRWDTEKSEYIKVGKDLAFEQWEKLSLEDKRWAWWAADKPSGKYVPDAFRWLRDRKFEDYERK